MEPFHSLIQRWHRKTHCPLKPRDYIGSKFSTRKDKDFTSPKQTPGKNLKVGNLSAQGVCWIQGSQDWVGVAPTGNQNLGAGQVEAADIGHVVYICFSSRKDQFSLLEMDECGALDPTTDEDGPNKLIDEPSQFSTG